MQSGKFFLDKVTCALVANMRTVDREFVADVTGMAVRLDSSRCEEWCALREGLQDVTRDLKQLVIDVCSEERISTCDVEYYRSAVLDLEGKLTAARDLNEKRLARLSQESSSLSAELGVLARRVELWGRPLSSGILQPTAGKDPAVARRSSNAGSSSTTKEVRDFEKFVDSSGGHTDGWEAEDHAVFLRLRTRHQGLTTALPALRELLPHKTDDEIRTHEEWFARYSDLKVRQQDAIKQWRVQRAEKKQESKQDCEEKTAELPARTSEETKQKILDWKRDQQLLKELETMQILENKLKDQEIQRKKAMEQEKRKVEVQKYREARWLQEQSRKLAHQRKQLHNIEEKTSQANLLIHEFRAQDRDMLARRATLRQQLSSRGRPLGTSSTTRQLADRDPARLLRPTGSWLGRCRSSPTRSAPPPLSLRTLPKLGVPSWRKGLDRQMC